MHYIFLVASAMSKFDPLADLVVSEDEFLTWRRGDQRLPNSQDTWLLFHTIGRGSDGRWFLEPCSEHRLVYPGIHAWLDRTAADAETGRLGTWHSSMYQGLFGQIDTQHGPGSNWQKYHKKVELLSKLVVADVRLTRSFPFDPRPLHPVEEWTRLSKDVLRQLYEVQTAAA